MNSEINILSEIQDKINSNTCPNNSDIAVYSSEYPPISYKQLNTTIKNLCDSLKSLEVTSSTRIAIIIPQGLAMSVTILSVMSCGVCVPLNHEHTEEELETLFTSANIDLVITRKSADTCIEAANSYGAPVIFIQAINNSEYFGFSFDASACKKVETKSKNNSDNSDSTRLILHTSGSTSTPKAVPLSLNNISSSVNNIIASLSLNDKDRCLNMMPQFHIGGIIDLLVAPLCSSGSIVLMPEISASNFAIHVKKYHPTWFQAVPTVLHNLIDTDSETLDIFSVRPFRFIRSVSSALPNWLLHDVEKKFNTQVIEMYGMTETSGLICSNSLDRNIEKQGSVGSPIGCKIRVVDHENGMLPAYISGKIQVRGNNVMSSYLGDNKSQDSKTIDGWFNTGDEGYLDSDGDLFITGRTKEIINRGGEKISPLEVDRVANQYPGIAHAATFGVGHETLGEEVSIAIVLIPNTIFDEKKFIAFMNSKLTSFKTPKTCHIVDKLPLTKGGKLQRYLIPKHIDNAAQTDKQAKKTKSETTAQQILLNLWCNVLSVDDIQIDDNFFDLGGDSLKAAIFLTKLETLLNTNDKLPSIFEAPTIRQFALYLNEVPNVTYRADSKLPDDIKNDLKKFLSSWEGDRRNEQSLIIGKNMKGNKRPLFWCINSHWEFDNFSNAIGDDQPVYGMRSLYHSEYKSDFNNELLAKHYVEEILSIQVKGPYQIGGFCEAAKIAFSIAKELSSRGKEISSLMIQDKFIPQYYDQRISFFICSPNFNSPYYSFLDAPKGWRKYYGGDLVVYKIKSKHTNVYHQPAIKGLCAQVNHEIRLSSSLKQTTKNKRNRLQKLSETAYQASISTSLGANMPPMHSFILNVNVTNKSDTTWLPTDRSGLLLCARWTNHRHKPRIWLAGHSKLESSVSPGETAIVSIALKTPPIFWTWILELDMVDDGVTWFSAKGSTPARYPVNISPLYWIYNRPAKNKVFET